MDLPDAPWIVESWWSGFGPEKDSPYDECDDAQFLDAADSEFGWRILAWELDIDPKQVPDESIWQDVWEHLKDKERQAMCESFRKWRRDEAAELYNTYWETWIGG